MYQFELKEVEGDLLACMKMKNHEINAEVRYMFKKQKIIF
jgi:hypothetical protein